MSKNKVVIELKLSDLRSSGIVKSKRIKKKTKKQKKASVYIGGPKSDSSHMIGSVSYLPNNPFNNTSTIGSEIALAQLKAIENNRFFPQKQLTDSNINEELIDRSFNKLMLPYFERQDEDLNRVKGVLNRGIAEFYDLQQDYNTYRPLLENSYNNVKVDYDDNAGITNPTLNSDQFVNGGLDIINDNINDTIQIPNTSVSVQSEIDKERFNPELPMTPEVVDENVSVRGQQPRSMKPKNRKTLFGAPRSFFSSIGLSSANKDKVYPSEEPADPGFDYEYPINDDSRFAIPEKAVTPVSNIPNVNVSPFFQQNNVDNLINEVNNLKPITPNKLQQTPEEIRPLKNVIKTQVENTMPKGMTIDKAKQMYKHLGGKDDYIDQMKNPQAVWGQITKLDNYKTAKPAKEPLLSERQQLKETASKLFEQKRSLVDKRKVNRMENEILSGNSTTLSKVIAELNKI
jgi:hypothetical protein